MSETTHIHVRDARDRLIDLLGMGETYPLRDLAVSYEPLVVPFNTSAKVLIEHSQKDVWYELHDEDDKKVDSETLENGTGILLKTPEIRDDVAYKIHASKKQSGKENYLHQTANVKVGPDVKLAASIPEAPVNYGASVEVEIERSQEGVVYRLVYLSKAGPGQDSSEEEVELPGAFKSSTDAEFSNQLDKKKVPRALREELNLPISDPVTVSVEATNSVWLIIGGEGKTYKIRRKDNRLNIYSVAVMRGDKKTIKITSQPVSEDTDIRIRATKTFDLLEKRDDRTALLDVELSLKVRANPAVEVKIEAPILDYEAKAKLSLADDAQLSAEYHLYKRELVLADYLSKQTVGCLEVKTDEGRRVYIRAPEKVTNWDDAPGFDSIGPFSRTESGKLSITTDSLLEDTLFIVKATKKKKKKKKREPLQLDQAVVGLVRPNPEPAIRVEAPPIAAGLAGKVLVDNTQKGVKYQLLAGTGTDMKAVNPPGYHFEERGVETTRLGVDFELDFDTNPNTQDNKFLKLPTGPLQTTTTVKVLAIKILTKVSAQLNGEATIDVLPE